MAWGDQFKNIFYLNEAEKNYRSLEDGQKQIVDAAIIKRLNRDAYEAALRIYEIRRCKNPETLVEIFNAIAADYLDPDRITIMRGCMAGFDDPPGSGQKTGLAEEELSHVGDYYQTVMLTRDRALELAADGITQKIFDDARRQLMPMAPLIHYVLRALKPEFVETQLPSSHIAMATAS